MYSAPLVSILTIAIFLVVLVEQEFNLDFWSLQVLDCELGSSSGSAILLSLDVFLIASEVLGPPCSSVGSWSGKLCEDLEVFEWAEFRLDRSRRVEDEGRWSHRNRDSNLRLPHGRRQLTRISLGKSHGNVPRVRS